MLNYERSLPGLINQSQGFRTCQVGRPGTDLPGNHASTCNKGTRDRAVHMQHLMASTSDITHRTVYARGTIEPFSLTHNMSG